MSTSWGLFLTCEMGLQAGLLIEGGKVAAERSFLILTISESINNKWIYSALSSEVI